MRLGISLTTLLLIIIIILSSCFEREQQAIAGRGFQLVSTLG